MTRPRSAPTLLRGDGFHKEAQAHKIQFLQEIENDTVRRTLHGFYREGLAKKARIDEVDVLHDTILFDLKVLHNASQRNQTAAAKRLKQRAEAQAAQAQKAARKDARVQIAQSHDRQTQQDKQAWRSLSSPARVRKLRLQLEEDVKFHVGRLDAYEQVGMDRPRQEESGVADPFALLRSMSAGLKMQPQEVTMLAPPEDDEALQVVF